MPATRFRYRIFTAIPSHALAAVLAVVYRVGHEDRGLAPARSRRGGRPHAVADCLLAGQVRYRVPVDGHRVESRRLVPRTDVRGQALSRAANGFSRGPRPRHRIATPGDLLRDAEARRIPA